MKILFTIIISFLFAFAGNAQCNYYQFPQDTSVCGNTATFTYPNLIPFRRFPFVGNFGSNNANLSVYFGVGTTGNTFTITNTTGGNFDTTIVYRIDAVDCSPWVGFMNIHFQSNTTPLNIVNQVGPCNEVAMLMVSNSGGATPSWSKLVGSTYVPVGTITSYTATTTGSYKATINTENGCPASGIINITSLGSPKKYLHDTAYCQTVGQPNFSIVDGQNTFCSYLWNNTNTGDEWVINPNTYMTGVGTAWVTITNTAGCVTKDTINWQAWNLPNPLLNSGVYMCNGSAVTLYDSSTNNYNHTWSYGGTYIGGSNSVDVHQTGTYHVFTTTEHGCSADNDVYVLESDAVDVAGFSFVPQQPYSARQIYFHALDVENVMDYLWDFGDGTTSNQVTPKHTFTGADSSLITLTVSNPNLNGDCKTKTISQMISTIKNSTPPTGINELGNPAYLTIYPNPTTGMIHISGDFIEASIMSINGTVIKSSKGDIDVSMLNGGLYILKIETTEGYVYHKIIKD
ncbi:T9SS type A sorting domain-containing protein [Taibaiella lutea]|uniref:T9SS type A sorting domain-containing protein n=1 Tax=Taibaiella lutea TaxID=2608001 RepID=A0A5M6CRP6_9BACT|nr:T9SS type A sorting domain-containing protein [Taibaiella lutea]KAA5537050.1 T9SS type A sorting domain-containing protein [Taibaiella lutea]